MRVLLVTGKGGVGKTTVAAATAVHAARCGLKTLVVSTDAAHSLGDCLLSPLGPDPVEVAGGLQAVEVDARAGAERGWDRLAQHVTGLLAEAGVDPVGAEELVELPGAADLLALLGVRDLVGACDHELVVVDCAPTAETLRLLALPEGLRAVTETLLPVERRVLRAIATGARAARGGAPPRDRLVDAVQLLGEQLRGLRELLTAPTSSVRLVLTPEAVVLAEARRTLTALALLGYAVDGIVVNRLVPDVGPADGFLAGWARAQAELLAAVAPDLEPVPVARLAFAASEPVGVAGLATLGEELHGRPGEASAAALLAPADAVERLRVERTGEEFELVLPLPLARREDVEAARVGDDLAVTVGGRRRLVCLPGALRRCDVVGAVLADGRLRVRFRPDPALWRRP